MTQPRPTLDRIESILVAVDRSEPSRGAIAAGVMMAKHVGAALQFIELDLNQRAATRVFFPPDRLDELATLLEACTGKPMAYLLGSIEDRGAVGYQPAEGRNAVDVVAEAAPGFQLVVVGTHGRRGADHLLHGSVAEEVVRRVACPVLVVPMHAA